MLLDKRKQHRFGVAEPPDENYRYFRIYGADATGAKSALSIYIDEIRLFDGANGTGNEYPPVAMTSPTSIAGYVVSNGANYYATNPNWKACDKTDFSYFRSTSGITTETNWWQIEIPTGLPPMLTIQVRMYGITQTNYLNGYMSKTGEFAGEEVPLFIGTEFRDYINVNMPIRDDLTLTPTDVVLSIDAVTPNSVTISWTPSESVDGIKNYVITRNGIKLATVNSNNTSYTDEGLISLVTYEYYVQPRTNGGVLGNASNTVQATTLSTDVAYVKLADPNGYSYYRFRSRDDNGNDTKLESGIYELALLAGATSYPPKMTSGSTGGYTVSEGYAYSSSYAGWKAFDDLTYSMWWTLGSIPNAGANWVQFRAPSILTGLTEILFRPNPTYHDAQRLYLQGSNNGSTFTDLGYLYNTNLATNKDYKLSII